MGPVAFAPAALPQSTESEEHAATAGHSRRRPRPEPEFQKSLELLLELFPLLDD